MAPSPGTIQSRLLALPRELRDEIYVLVFEGEVIDPTCSKRKHYTSSLCLTSKQVYSETVRLYYKHTAFTFDYLYPGLWYLMDIPAAYRAQIQHIALAGPDMHSAPRQRLCYELFDFKMRKFVFELKPGVLKYRIDSFEEGEKEVWAPWPPKETE